MLGIFGGSFDPIHFGHIKLALALLEHFEFDQIRLIPCQQSSLKETPLASAEHRWEMLNLVTSSHEKLVTDTRELERQGTSYTIDTLIEIREETDSKTPIVLIIGVDTFNSFCEWHRYDEILSLCHIMLLQRPGYELPKHGCEKELFDNFSTRDISKFSNTLNGKIYLSDEEKIDVSSTTIRAYISDGQQPRYLLPGNIWNYIKRNNLYK